jgi:sugar phosphate isomerase/epimerase
MNDMPDPSNLSVQLYTLRARLAADVDATLATLADIGFRRVEPFDLLTYHDGLRDGLPRHGLSAPTTHAETLGPDADAVFEAAAELGIETVVQPWVEPARWSTADGIRALADDLNAASSRAAGHGLRVGYHNHHFELESHVDGRHGLEVFADHLAPEVVLEVDTYWALAGGADVPALLGRLGSRVVALHIKDGDGSLDTRRQVPAGSGVLPVRAIVEAAPDALRVVEFDDTEGDLVEAVRASRAFLLDLARG